MRRKTLALAIMTSTSAQKKNGRRSIFGRMRWRKFSSRPGAKGRRMESKDEWTPPGEAVSLLEPTFEGASLSAAYEARRIICNRAHAGLIHSRARLFIVTRSRPRRFQAAIERHEDYDIPAEFWQDVSALVNQNWTAG